jgi:hypothetical protein
MKLKDIKKVKSEDEARQIAIDWANWVANNSLSYGELIEFWNYFAKLAKKFHLEEEFKENGIL